MLIVTLFVCCNRFSQLWPHGVRRRLSHETTQTDEQKVAESSKKLKCKKQRKLVQYFEPVGKKKRILLCTRRRVQHPLVVFTTFTIFSHIAKWQNFPKHWRKRTLPSPAHLAHLPEQQVRWKANVRYSCSSSQPEKLFVPLIQFFNGPTIS